MDMIKIGSFLQELRKEKGITQEQLAEQLGVARRTISRWETGSNMPDVDILVELSDLYSVDLREILSGERKSEQMNEEMKETVLQVAEYSNEDKQKFVKRTHILFVAGLVSVIMYLVLRFTDYADTFWSGLCLGFAFSMIIVGTIMTSKYAAKIRNFKFRLFEKH